MKESEKINLALIFLGIFLGILSFLGINLNFNTEKKQKTEYPTQNTVSEQKLDSVKIHPDNRSDDITKKEETSAAEQKEIKMFPLSSLITIEKNAVILGTGKTDFTGSSKDRIININIGSSKIDGITIKPNEEFSTLKTIGRITARKGYKLEANIRDGKTVMALGGGVCQVSTTLFRATLNAGLKITRRYNHSYPIEYYYPQGTDAAIAYPYKDFKFINDTGYPISIKRKIEDSQLIFDIYGTNIGRSAKINGPYITKKEKDGSFKTILYQEVYQDGKLARKSSFPSFYLPKSKFPHE